MSLLVRLSIITWAPLGKCPSYQHQQNLLVIFVDFILLAVFVGNNFLPNSPDLHIHENGLERLFDVYRKVLPGLGMLFTNSWLRTLTKGCVFIDGRNNSQWYVPTRFLRPLLMLNLDSKALNDDDSHFWLSEEQIFTTIFAYIDHLFGRLSWRNSSLWPGTV